MPWFVASQDLAVWYCGHTHELGCRSDMLKLIYIMLFLLSRQLQAQALTVVGPSGETLAAIVDRTVVTLLEFRPGMVVRLRLAEQEKRITLRSPDPVGVRLGGRRFELRPLPADFPRYQFSGRSRLNLPIVFSASKHDDTVDSCHLLVLSGDGVIDFYRRLPYPCVDFRPHIVGGKLYYSYHHTKAGARGLGYVGTRTVLDAEFRPLETLAQELDHHEFLFLRPGHWVGIELKLGRLRSGMAYYDKRVREWKDGKLVFDWGVADFLRQFDSEAAAMIRLTDWNGELVADVLHLNSVQRVGDDGFLVGLGTNGVAFVERSSSKVRWVLGGLNDQFGLSHAQHPHFSHTPYFEPARQELVLFSNGRLFDGVTQVLSYRLDLKEKRLVKFEVLRSADELSSLLGSVQVIEGQLSLSFGLKSRGAYDFLEQAPTGEVSASFKFLSPQAVPYRIYRRPFGD